MRILAVLFTILCAGIAHAALTEGTYEGKDNSGKAYELHLKGIDERRGSFLGALIDPGSNKVRTYLVDGFSKSRYGLLSLRSTGNFNLGVRDISPALSLVATDENIIVTPNGATGDDMGFNSSITFKAKKRQNLRWSSLNAGNYNSKKFVVSNLDSAYEATVSSKVDSLAGDFIFREIRPDLYILIPSELTPTGVKLSRTSTLYGMFVSGSFFQGGNKLYVFDSETGASFNLKK